MVPPSHPWATRDRPVTGAELAATRLVQREPSSGTRAALEHALAPFGRPPQPLLELATTSGVRNAVIAGAGPAVLSNLAVAEAVAAGVLVAVPVTGASLTRTLRAVWPVGQRPLGPARALLAVAARRPAPG